MLVPRGLFLQQAYHFTPECTPVLQTQRIWCDNINYHLISDGLYKFHLEGLEGTPEYIPGGRWTWTVLLRRSTALC